MIKFPVSLLLLLLCAALAGCTAVGVRKPVGPAPHAGWTASFDGTWVSGNGVIFTIGREDDPAWMHVRYVDPDDGIEKTAKFVATSFGADCTVLWGLVAPGGFYSPVRVVEGERALALLTPDVQEVERLVESGALRKASEEFPEDDSWILLEPEGLEEVMAGKSFWDLSNAMIFMRKENGKEGGDSAAASSGMAPAGQQDHETAAP